MKSNVEFKSNVFPIKNYIYDDKEYLSKIYDHTRLKYLDRTSVLSKHYNLLNDIQRKILQENPVCYACDPDPCWGMIKKDGKIQWACKCVRMDCKHFSECRPDFNIVEFDQFSPLVNSLEGYDYIYEQADTIYNPILDIDDEYYDENYYYSEFKIIDKTTVNNDDNQDNVVDIVKSVLEEEIIKQAIEDEHDDLEDENVFDELTKNINLIDSKIIIQDDLKEFDYNKDQYKLENENLSVKLEDKTVLEDNKSNNIFASFIECDQERIIKADSKEIQFINAGPGTGKTYTLIQKINYMVTQQDIDPESIMVLCFTNAAVDEIKERLNAYVLTGADRGLANVDVRTFHSFAWWLIHQANDVFIEDGWKIIDMSNLNFDKSIDIANKIITKFANDILCNWEHFIVDEVQDLTNNLAQFVLNIIGGCLNFDCGITILGDACQAIYDYTQTNCKNPITSDEFYNRLYKQICERAQFLKLTVNHRQVGELSELAVGLRKSIISNKFEDMQEEIKKLNNRINNIGNISEFKKSEIKTFLSKGKTCILFRNNGETLCMSSNLRKQGISHKLTIYENTRNYAAWISDVFASYNKPKIDFSTFSSLYNSLKNKKYTDDYVWSRLHILMHNDNDVLEIFDIIENIGISKIDDPVFREIDNNDLIISNIHRAKGREYDNVLIDKNFLDKLSNCKEYNEVSEEYKTMYVALTRPKSQINSFIFKSGEKFYPIEIFASQHKRWGKIVRKKKMTFLEFKMSLDLDIMSFAFIDQSIFSTIQEGDALYLRRTTENGKLIYKLVHENSNIDLVNILPSYAGDIKSRMKISKFIDMPSRITDLYVSGIYSEIVDNEFLKNHPDIAQAAPNGVWKWIDVIGIGHLIYDIY